MNTIKMPVHLTKKYKRANEPRQVLTMCDACGYEDVGLHLNEWTIYKSGKSKVCDLCFSTHGASLAHSPTEFNDRECKMFKTLLCIGNTILKEIRKQHEDN